MSWKLRTDTVWCFGIRHKNFKNWHSLCKRLHSGPCLGKSIIRCIMLTKGEGVGGDQLRGPGSIATVQTSSRPHHSNSHPHTGHPRCHGSSIMYVALRQQLFFPEPSNSVLYKDFISALTQRWARMPPFRVSKPSNVQPGRKSFLKPSMGAKGHWGSFVPWPFLLCPWSLD